MSIHIATFIDRLPNPTPKPALKIENMTKTASNINQQDAHQYGAVHKYLLNGNEGETSIEVIGLHLHTAASVIVLLLMVFALIFLWRVCKQKNRRKICWFLCVKRCQQ